MSKKLSVGVIGATGFTGETLVEILLRHQKVEITHLSAKIENPASFSELFPRFKGALDVVCELPDIRNAAEEADLFFLALPHTVSLQCVPTLLSAKKRVIDLSADYRLKDAGVYQSFYNMAHTDTENLPAAVYGLPEIYREKIATANLVANPGCFPTVCILALAPLLKYEIIQDNSIIIDAKTGISGAGRKPGLLFHYCTVNENVRPYKINRHQHIPEIIQELSLVAGREIEVTFCPHVVALDRGIFVTIYCAMRQNTDEKKIARIYQEMYQNEPFVRIYTDGMPQLQNVLRTNYCDIGFSCFPQKRQLIITAAIDNLLKGASGQAVQNMNCMYGYDQKVAL